MEYLGLAETKSVPRCLDLHHPRATVKFLQAWQAVQAAKGSPSDSQSGPSPTSWPLPRVP
jgi:hypothetical protein